MPILRGTLGYSGSLALSNSGVVSVTASGAITLGTGGNGISGAVSADGDLIVAAPITSNGNGSTPVIYVAVKQGAGVTAATINGVYTMVSLSTGSTLTANDGKSSKCGHSLLEVAGDCGPPSTISRSMSSTVAGRRSPT